MAQLLKGAPVASEICEKVQDRVSLLRDRGVVPTLATVRVGENDGDIYYERSALKRCGSLGIETESIVFPENVEESELLDTIHRLNNDSRIHGVLIFRPLPKHIDDQRVRDALSPEKDIDGITDGSLAGVFTGSGRGFCPCTAQSCMEILRYYKIDCTGMRAVVLGRSLVIGKPVSQLLLANNATVTVCHTRTQDISSETRRADIIVAAVGHAHAIGVDHVSPGQIIIDVGTNTGEDGKMCGDADTSLIEPIVHAITPVPGGVGSVTTAVLALHTVEAAERAVCNTNL